MQHKNDNPRSARKTVLGIVLVLATSIGLGLLLNQRRNQALENEELCRQRAELRAQVEAHEQTIAALKKEIRELQFTEVPPQESPKETPVQSPAEQKAQAEAERAKRVARSQAVVAKLESIIQEQRQKAEAARQKSAELFTGLRVPVEVLDAEKPGDDLSMRPYWPYFQARRERETIRQLLERLEMRKMQELIDAGDMTALESISQEQEEKALAAREKAAQLLVDLQIPAEIARLDPDQGLDMPKLRPYWPYFQAKQERETTESINERLRLRLIQERVEKAIEPAR